MSDSVSSDPPVPEKKRSASPLALVVGSVAAVAAAALIVMTAQVLLVLFAGVLLAIVLLDSSRWLAKKTHVSRGICLTAIVVVWLGLVAAFVILSAGHLAEQVAGLSKALPRVLERVQAYLHSDPLAQNIARVLPGAGSAPAGPPGASHPPGAAGASGDDLAKGALAALGALTHSLEFLGALAIVFFVGVYGSAQPELHVRSLLAVTPKQHHDKVRNALGQIRHTLSRWMAGRLVAMLFVGVTTGIAFHVLSIPAALTLAVFAGLLTFVEYAGAIISAIPPVLLALGQSTGTALAVLVVFTVLHVIEGYILTPLLARAAVHVPPAFAVAGQAVFGVLLGPLGLTFSTPLIVTVASAVKGLRETEHAEG